MANEYHLCCFISLWLSSLRQEISEQPKDYSFKSHEWWKVIVVLKCFSYHLLYITSTEKWRTVLNILMWLPQWVPIGSTLLIRLTFCKVTFFKIFLHSLNSCQQRHPSCFCVTTTWWLDALYETDSC